MTHDQPFDTGKALYPPNIFCISQDTVNRQDTTVARGRVRRIGKHFSPHEVVRRCEGDIGKKAVPGERDP